MLENLQPADTAKICKIVQTITTLEPKDATVLNDAINDAVKWSNNGLSDALKSRGLSISPETIRRHRRNVCPCRKVA
jgi:hypothetical protein